MKQAIGPTANLTGFPKSSNVPDFDFPNPTGAGFDRIYILK